MSFFFQWFFRCEHTLANAAGEAQSLTEAGRAFLQVEDASQMLCCPSFEEHLMRLSTVTVMRLG